MSFFGIVRDKQRMSFWKWIFGEKQQPLEVRKTTISCLAQVILKELKAGEYDMTERTNELQHRAKHCTLRKYDYFVYHNGRQKSVRIVQINKNPLSEYEQHLIYDAMEYAIDIKKQAADDAKLIELFPTCFKKPSPTRPLRGTWDM